MRHSRYTWIMLISLLSLIGMVSWAGPQTVWSALAKVDFANDEIAAVNRFWNALDVRQIETAKALFVEGEKNQAELNYWTDLVVHDPLIRVQKIETTKGKERGIVQVKIDWINEQQGVYSYLCSFHLIDTGEGWKIQEMQRVDHQQP